MTLLLMSKNGCGSTAPFWMILIVPPCSTTKSRPELSPGCSRSSGELNPEAVTWVLTALAVGELLLPPQPRRKTHTLNPEDRNRHLSTPRSHFIRWYYRQLPQRK